MCKKKNMLRLLNLLLSIKIIELFNIFKKNEQFHETELNETKLKNIKFNN